MTKIKEIFLENPKIYKASLWTCDCPEKERITSTTISTGGGNKPQCYGCKKYYNIKRVNVVIIDE